MLRRLVYHYLWNIGIVVLLELKNFVPGVHCLFFNLCLGLWNGASWSGLYSILFGFRRRFFLGDLLFGLSWNLLPSLGVLFFLLLFHKLVDLVDVILNNLLVLLPHFLFNFLFSGGIFRR